MRHPASHIVSAIAILTAAFSGTASAGDPSPETQAVDNALREFQATTQEMQAAEAQKVTEAVDTLDALYSSGLAADEIQGATDKLLDSLQRPNLLYTESGGKICSRYSSIYETNSGVSGTDTYRGLRISFKMVTCGETRGTSTAYSAFVTKQNGVNGYGTGTGQYPKPDEKLKEKILILINQP